MCLSRKDHTLNAEKQPAMQKILLVFLYTLLIVFSALAQEPLSTDRPGEGTDAPTLVPKGAIQLETGFFLQEDQERGGAENTLMKVPTTLLRFGLLDNFELRISEDLLLEEEVGAGALNVGAKIGIAPEGNVLPALSLSAMLTLPATGSERYQSQFTQPSLKLLMNKSLSEFLGLTGNLGVQWENDQPQAVYTYALSFDLSLADKIGGFVEFYGALPEADDNIHQINYGLIFLVAPLFQIDVASGLAFTGEAPDYYIGAGISWRLDVFAGK